VSRESIPASSQVASVMPVAAIPRIVPVCYKKKILISGLSPINKGGTG